MTDRAYWDDAQLRRRRNLRVFLLILLSVALFAAALWFTISTLTRPVVDTGDIFMTALKEGDFPRAYRLAAPDLQRELGSPRELAVRAERGRPADWSWSSRSVRNGTGRVSGSYATLEGRPGRAELMLRKMDDGQWRIAAFRFSAQ